MTTDTDTAIAVRDLKTHLSSVLAQVRRGQRVTVTAHRKPIATIEPLPQPGRGLPAIAGVVWADSGQAGQPGHQIGRHTPAELLAGGETVSELLLRQRGV